VINSFWEGIVGIGAYVDVAGVFFMHYVLSNFKGEIFSVVDPYNPDGYGGLRELSVFFLKLFLITVVLLGLMVGSVPYSVSFTLLSAILIIANATALSLLMYGLTHIHIVLRDFKQEKLAELSNELSELRTKTKKHPHNLLLRFDLIEKELYYKRITMLKVWPLRMSDIVNFLSLLASFMPLLLRFSI
jgi:hypothetical protein